MIKKKAADVGSNPAGSIFHEEIVMKYIHLKIGKALIKAEIADSPLKKVKGLMFRKKLKNNEGMFFDFYRTRPGIWLFGMRFPIDIIWINSAMHVVDINKNAKPWKFWKIYEPKERARYALEVNGGFADKNNIKLWNEIKVVNKKSKIKKKR
jgi:uncharacterized membrane protein (UPF0127 family)